MHARIMRLALERQLLASVARRPDDGGRTGVSISEARKVSADSSSFGAFRTVPEPSYKQRSDLCQWDWPEIVKCLCRLGDGRYERNASPMRRPTVTAPSL
jgi:hypothetical protein